MTPRLDLIPDLSTLDPADAEAVLAVVAASFDAFVAPDYTDEGRRLFFSLVTPDYLRSLPERNGFTVVARVGGTIAGMCAVRDGHHITLFFVAAEFQGQGIGRRLFDESVARIRTHAPAADRIEVHSSPIAVPVYQTLGFRADGDVQDEGGIRYVPMSCALTPAATERRT